MDEQKNQEQIEDSIHLEDGTSIDINEIALLVDVESLELSPYQATPYAK